jgi:hypothetical protein
MPGSIKRGNGGYRPVAAAAWPLGHLCEFVPMLILSIC